MTKFYVVSFDQPHTQNGIVFTTDSELKALEYAFKNSDYITNEDMKLDSIRKNESAKFAFKEHEPAIFYQEMLNANQPNDGRGLTVYDETEYQEFIL